MNWLQLSGAFELGLIYALVAMGVYITFRIIDFPDLTVDGSFALGGVVAIVLLLNHYPPLLATFIATLCGAMAGILTGYLHTRWNILGILASILVMTALYSVNLRLMNQPNVALQNELTLFSWGSILWITALIVILSLVILVCFFHTHFGLAMRATHVNMAICHAYGIQTTLMKIIALALSNGIVALSGALFAQSQGFADISMGTGTIIVGLASVILGESLFSPKQVVYALLACIIGSILYRVAIVLALNGNQFGLLPSDLNLITALLVISTLILPRLKQ
ncbi:ABC transporter permease subunit [Candidatus Berkiella aquae]|uniref:ABC transporter permease n=1 Tax=Candidatus Berkiella aquae TaxID=295108 RepID=A0A0Q9YWP0_9GAMM|nr:ABC transporter permease [Candidatus Berkiella aquae]MCS5712171.1 ABC transporter permease [Candidatus Berkiella aquae]